MTTMRPAVSTRPLRRVVVVFKTHFDLGFTDLPADVMAQYTGPMFGQVAEVMRATADRPPGSRYAWTLPAWPLKEFVHGAATPDSTREESRALIEDGRLHWHAWPFTTHTSFCGLEDLVRGLHISRALSEEFGRFPTGAKQTDVPGHTWILPSLLSRAGVKFLHLGCNPGSHSPHVPRLFWWEGPDRERLLTYYSPGGYGTSLLPTGEWGLDTWLAVQQTTDNEGPQSPEYLEWMRSELASKAPGVELVIGELGDFAGSLLEHPEQLDGLPVVPYDLADTWIHGVGTMPREVARVRALRASLLEMEVAAATHDWPFAAAGGDFAAARTAAADIDAAYEQLMLFGEHTWGLDVKRSIMREFGPAFKEARQNELYQRLESSWVAKGQYVVEAEAAAGRAGQALAGAGVTYATEQAPAAQARRDGNTLENDWVRLSVDPERGGISSLTDTVTGREWVDLSAAEPFGGYRYDIYSMVDIAEFLRAYGLYFQDWFTQDFGKAGYPEDSTHLTAFARGFTLSESAGGLLLSGGRLAPGESGTVFAPAQRVSIEVSLPGGGPFVDLRYRIEGKEATHLAESAVVPFPLSLPKAAFRLGQVGSVIDPARDIVAGANHSLWCADGWIDASDDRAGLAVVPLDMPLVSIGHPGIYAFEAERREYAPVLYSHLFNTQWGTNFPQWLDSDFEFRVRLVMHAGDWRAGRVWEAALMAQRPAALAAGGEVTLPDGLVLLAMRPRHDGRGLVLRFWDATGLPRRARISVRGSLASALRCDLMERPGDTAPLTHEEGGAAFDINVAPHAVETVLLEFRHEG